MPPEWLVVGLAVAGLFTLAAAVLFVAAEWLFPSRGMATTRTTTEGGRPGNRKRRAEIRTYLGAIGERYAEDHPVAGETVAFYLPDRDVAVTFDPRVYFQIRVTDTHAILAEAEMPGAGLGARLPFEVPDVEGSGSRGTPGDGSPADDPACPEWAFARLGLEPNASDEAVRRAYRERVKGAHPDHGGDPEQFKRLREAYTAATNNS